MTTTSACRSTNRPNNSALLISLRLTPVCSGMAEQNEKGHVVSRRFRRSGGAVRGNRVEGRKIQNLVQPVHRNRRSRPARDDVFSLRPLSVPVCIEGGEYAGYPVAFYIRCYGPLMPGGGQGKDDPEFRALLLVVDAFFWYLVAFVATAVLRLAVRNLRK